MKEFKKKFFFITVGLISSLSFHTLKVNAGSFGAEIFCTMRDGGNDHESSWDAAYTYIKKHTRTHTCTKPFVPQNQSCASITFQNKINFPQRFSTSVHSSCETKKRRKIEKK